jgi:hypothetical protein
VAAHPPIGIRNGRASAGMVGWGWSCAVEWFDWIECEIEVFVVGVLVLVLGNGLDTVSVDLGGHG